MSFDDDEFDLSYHNGLWALFENNQDIKKMLEEQARVTKYRLIATAHNKHNVQFVEYFDRLAETDPLYKIRFFEVEEITEIMEGYMQKNQNYTSRER